MISGSIEGIEASLPGRPKKIPFIPATPWHRLIVTLLDCALQAEAVPPHCDYILGIRIHLAQPFA
jgi:hypothetical protein